MSILEKFTSDGVVGDVIDGAPGQALKVSYPSGAAVNGAELTPTQVKDEPKVEWEADTAEHSTLCS